MKWVDRACFFMICTNDTEKECLERGLFGDQEWLFPYLQVIKKGDIGFLINISKGGKFPAQINVKLITKEYRRIDRASFRLNSILELKEIKRDKFPYKIPKQKTYGPDVTNKVLGLFKVDDDFYLNLEMYDDLGLFPQYKLEDVAGLGEVKKFIYQRVIAPFEDEELASKLRLKIGGGMLLFGPPGTGKTLIAMAIANHIQAKFIDISPSVIIGYPGEAEKRLENIFHELEKEPRAVLFLDEAEWILCRREDQTSSVMQRVTPVLLSQLGRIFKNKNKPIIVIAATNKPQMIDSAFLRPGRFDKLFYIGLPDEDARVEIIKMQLRDRPHDLTEAQIKKVAKRLEGYSGADIEQIIEEAAFLAFESKDYDNDVKITVKHINEAIDKTPKSVSEEEVRSIEEWARMRNVIE
jgi:SpoVK/Ycf46/Vps4 family AAA+-type ATPase